MKLVKQMGVFSILFLLIVAQSLFSSPHAFAAGNSNKTVKVEVVGKGGVELLNPTPVSIGDTSTALDALKSAVGAQQVNVNNGMIIGIKGLSSPTDWSAYWSFYINGVSAPVGAGSYKPKAQDQLLFDYHPKGVLPNEVQVTIPDKSYGTTTLDVKVSSGDTLLSVLQKMNALYHVTFQTNQLIGVGSFVQDASHSWVITDKRDGTTTTVSDLSKAQVKGQDQITLTLKASTGSSTGKSSTGSLIQGKVVTSKELSTSIQKATQFVNQHGVSEWEAIALSKAGQPVPSTYLKHVTKTVSDASGNFHSITDTERYALGILAAGGDPTHVGGVNLISKIYSGDLTKQGLNGVIFGLIALDSASFKIPGQAKWTPSKLVDTLLKDQNSDGGWAWDGGKTSDLDTTGMAITALSKESSSTKVKTAIQKAETYIADQFQKGKVDNSSTDAQLVIGLTANQVNPEGTDFTLKDGTTLMSQLLSYQQKDGGFDWKTNDESAFSTQQGFLGLVADQLFSNKKGELYTFSWKKSVQPATSQSGSKTGKGTSQSGSQSTDQPGNALPNTSTPFYNYLIFGGLLILIGVYLERKYRKKRV